jgi:RNA polymerase sigma factor (sigma-70 family)
MGVSRESPTLAVDVRTRLFEGIFRANHRRVLAYALRRTSDREQAEEVVSEVFLIAWRRLSELPPDPSAWLLGTARRVLANQRRSARRRFPDGPHLPLEVVETADARAATAERIAERAAFAVAFAGLSATDRELLALIFWEGLSNGEAAKVLGCSRAALAVRLHRARRRLLEGLRASGHSSGERNEVRVVGRQAERSETR